MSAALISCSFAPSNTGVARWTPRGQRLREPTDVLLLELVDELGLLGEQLLQLAP